MASALIPQDILNDLVSKLSSLNVSQQSQPALKESDLDLSIESYMTWDRKDTDPRSYLKYIQTAESHFSVYTINAFASGASIPAQEVPGQLVGFDENKKFNMFEHVTNLGALTYFHAQLGQLDPARHYVTRAIECFEQIRRDPLILPPEYLESFRYCIGLVARYAWNKCGGNIDDRWCRWEIPNFESLSSKGQAGVFGMKQYFWKMIKMDIDTTLDIARKVVQLDPEFYEWYYCLQACLRSKRRRHSYHHFQPNPVPTEEEKNAVVRSNQLHPCHPRCMLAEILILADCIKATFSPTAKAAVSKLNESSKKQDFLYYNNLDLRNVEVVVDFMSRQAIEILKLSPTSVHINTTIAEIFTVLLPHRFRDFYFAKTCLEVCLATHPWSSKANHRMATFFLNAGPTVEGMAMSEHHFRIAVTADQQNYPSLCGLIQVMMRNVKYNWKDLLEFVNEKLGVDYWDAVQQGNLFYFKGLILFAVNKLEAAVNAFIGATRVHADSLTFEDLPYQHRRYNWPTDSPLQPDEMFQVISRYRSSSKWRQHDFLDNIMLPKLKGAINKEKAFKRTMNKQDRKPSESEADLEGSWRSNAPQPQEEPLENPAKNRHKEAHKNPDKSPPHKKPHRKPRKKSQKK